jgi:hypothetical protein
MDNGTSHNIQIRNKNNLLFHVGRKICLLCEKEQPIDSFSKTNRTYKYNVAPDGRIVHCNACEETLKPKTREQIFWENIDKKGENECWEWTGYCIDSGYGQMRNSGNLILTHIYSYNLHHGPVPEGKEVCHKCNNRPCCNPKHLYADTHKGNMEYAARLGRITNTGHKLTINDVKDIRKMVAKGASNTAIAKQFSISTQSVTNIRTGKTWRGIA